MRKVVVTLVMVVLVSAGIAAGTFSAYDFTFFPTADKSMMTFSTSGDVGLDFTGYGYIGTTSTKGAYLRIAIQTPYDTILQTIDMIQQRQRLLLEEVELGGNELEDLITNQGIEQTTPIVDPGEGAEEQVVTNTEQNTKWTLSVTAGPSYRSFMGNNAIVYLGIGAANTFHLENEVVGNTKNTRTSSEYTLGADMDFGCRFYSGSGSTTIRVGVHIIADVLGWSHYKVTDELNETLEEKSYFYGYAFAQNSIFETLYGRGYIRLANTYMAKTTTKYNYTNRTPLLGKGSLREAID